MEFRNAKYSSADNSRVDLEYNDPKWGWIPFTADPNDVEDHGKELYALAVAGEVAPYQAPSIDQIRRAMPSLSARQFRLGLVTGGFTLSQVAAAIEAMPEGTDKEIAKIEWEYATEFERTHPLISSIGSSLGLTEEQIDTMWNGAVNL